MYIISTTCLLSAVIMVIIASPIASNPPLRRPSLPSSRALPRPGLLIPSDPPNSKGAAPDVPPPVTIQAAGGGTAPLVAPRFMNPEAAYAPIVVPLSGLLPEPVIPLNSHRY
ncbi:hypothetical protein C8J57DRAFT_1710534 [Mycena rebaudengoi]|nr:hypothetical protein C8J57DRAFT_1710534 [Mycena rebaudengoi]